MIIKSLTWCQYQTGWFGQSDKYLLPGQTIPLKKGVVLKQAQAIYSDSNLLLTDRGFIDVDKIATTHLYDNTFLPCAETGLSELKYRGRNAPMLGDNNNPFVDENPLVTHYSLKAKDWVNAAGGLLEIYESHSIYVAIEASPKETGTTKVWCPTEERKVNLKLIDVPLVFLTAEELELSCREEYQIQQKTPFIDKQWWIWNAITTRAVKRQVGERKDWIKHADTYVNTTLGVDESLRGNELYSQIDSNYRRIMSKKSIPPAGKFETV